MLAWSKGCIAPNLSQGSRFFWPGCRYFKLPADVKASLPQVDWAKNELLGHEIGNKVSGEGVVSILLCPALHVLLALQKLARIGNLGDQCEPPLARMHDDAPAHSCRHLHSFPFLYVTVARHRVVCVHAQRAPCARATSSGGTRTPSQTAPTLTRASSLASSAAAAHAPCIALGLRMHARHLMLLSHCELGVTVIAGHA